MQLFRTLIFTAIILMSAQVSAQQFSFFQPTNKLSTVQLRYTGLPSDVVPTEIQSLQESDSPGQSNKKAILASLVFPGWGERMLGEDTRGTVFTSTEAILWLGFIGLSAYESWRVQDYQTYAKNHAGIKAAGKDGQYWIDIAGYDNIHNYNDIQLQNRNPERVYPVTPEYTWDWESYDDRYRYDSIRIESRKVSQYTTFTAGAIVFNHLLSALDVSYLFNSNLQATDNSISYNIDVPLR
mgnify:CR=1 FL=1